MIHNELEFENNILLNYFSGMSLKKFKNKLKFYLFIKTPESNTFAYFHPCFQKNRPEIVCKLWYFSKNFLIKRKKEVFKRKLELLMVKNNKLQESITELAKKHQQFIDFNLFLSEILSNRYGFIPISSLNRNN